MTDITEAWLRSIDNRISGLASQETVERNTQATRDLSAQTRDLSSQTHDLGLQVSKITQLLENHSSAIKRAEPVIQWHQAYVSEKRQRAENIRQVATLAGVLGVIGSLIGAAVAVLKLFH